MGFIFEPQKCFTNSLICGFLISSYLGEILSVETDKKKTACEPKILEDVPPDPVSFSHLPHFGLKQSIFSFIIFSFMMHLTMH
jgi:hypothetical protein